MASSLFPRIALSDGDRAVIGKMGCCGDRQKLTAVRAEQRWDYIVRSFSVPRKAGADTSRILTISSPIRAGRPSLTESYGFHSSSPSPSMPSIPLRL